MTAFAAGGHGLGANFVPELNNRDEAVATRAVPLLRSGIGPRAERGQRAPHGRSESDRNAGCGVAERLDHIAVDALEAIDVAPRRFPRTKIGSESVGSVRERLQQNIWRRFGAH